MKLKRGYWVQLYLHFRSAIGRAPVVELSGNWAVTVSLDCCTGLDTDDDVGTRAGVIHRV